MANEIEPKDSIKDILAQGGCILGNVGEMFDETSDVMVEDADGKVILNFEGARDVLQVVWNKFKETMSECAGKEIEVKLPSGYVGVILSAALAAIGFKL